MSSVSRFLSLFCCTALLICTSLASQAQGVPQKVILEKYVVKAGANDKFEEVIKKFKEAVNKTKAPYRWLVSQSFVGGRNSYNIVIPFSSWGTFSEQRDVLKEAYSKREVERIMGLMTKSVVKEKVMSYTFNTDASRPLPAGSTEAAVLLYYIKVKQGMGPQYQEFAKQIKEATDATAPDVHFEFFNPGIGADSYMVVVPVKDLKDLDKAPKPMMQRMTEHFGKEKGMKLVQQGEGTVASFKSQLQMVRPDLALPPEQQ